MIVALVKGIYMHTLANPTLAADETGFGSFLAVAVARPAATDIACLRLL